MVQTKNQPKVAGIFYFFSMNVAQIWSDYQNIFPTARYILEITHFYAARNPTNKAKDTFS
ncbi:MAG: hypothetical protein WCR52_19625 [Bacteroidota bacterium]